MTMILRDCFVCIHGDRYSPLSLSLSLSRCLSFLEFVDGRAHSACCMQKKKKGITLHGKRMIIEMALALNFIITLFVF
jgi:hypothetical protein